MYKRMIFVVSCGFLLVPASADAQRQVINLDGTWEVAQGDMDTVPPSFERHVPVPGLVDMAIPAFEQVGHASPQRQAFWYRRSFVLDDAVPDVAVLKVRKAEFGSRLFINGQLVGDNDLCFTAGQFNIAEYLQGGGQTNAVPTRVNHQSFSAYR